MGQEHALNRQERVTKFMTISTGSYDDDNKHGNNNKTYYGILLILIVIILQVVAARYIQFSIEAKRRIQHAITGHILVLVSYYIPKLMCILLLCVASIIIWYIRVYQFDLYVQYFGPLLRANEKIQHSDDQNTATTSIVLPGAFYFLIGSMITATIFPLHIAQYSVECLALADPMAAYIGQTIVSPKIIYSGSNASISGTIACFVTAWMIGYVMLLHHDNNVTLITITLGALACSFAEAIYIFGNDNVQIPIVTAFVVTILVNL